MITLHFEKIFTKLVDVLSLVQAHPVDGPQFAPVEVAPAAL